MVLFRHITVDLTVLDDILQPIFDNSTKSTLVVVGGGVEFELKADFCYFTDDKLDCTEQESSLFFYGYNTIHLFKVEKDFEKILNDTCL